MPIPPGPTGKKKRGGARPGAGRKPKEVTENIERSYEERLAAAARAWEVLKQIADDPTVDNAVRVKAAQSILDRVEGKPKQQVVMSGGMDMKHHVIALTPQDAGEVGGID